jgi:hypothetical protein
MAVPTCGQVAIDEKLQILVREQQLLQEKRAAGLTNETFHPWMNEWLSHEEMVKEKVRAYMPSNLCALCSTCATFPSRRGTPTSVWNPSGRL